jgi:polysaccharide export outer membrane protein
MARHVFYRTTKVAGEKERLNPEQTRKGLLPHRNICIPQKPRFDFPIFTAFKAGIIISVVFFFNACTSSKTATYFNELGDAVIPSNTPVPESIIQKNDILSINVTSLNAEATLIFNSPGNGSGASANMISGGYLVDENGNIEFPVLGTLKAEGLTKNQLKDTITSIIVNKGLLLGPNVNIRFLNFRVTVLGEVLKPVVVTVPSEKISLLEALGMAGDMTIFAKRSNVLLIREESNQKITKRLDLNSNDLLTSPYYYLKNNDIVYVSPNQAKISSARESRMWLPSILTALALIFSIFKYGD